MKKAILIICAMFIGIGAQAQDEKNAIGVNLSYGTEISNIGIGAKYQRSLSEKLRLEGAFDYFLKKDYLSMWDINLNAHYLFPLSEKFKIYPLAGLTYTNWSFDSDGLLDDMFDDWKEYLGEEDDEDGSDSEGKFGVNLGVGLQYDLSSRLVLNVEGKYQLISDLNQAVFSVGLAYRF